MGKPVGAAKYRTCICGKVCKGGAALVNHGRKCEVERGRSWAFLRAVELGKTPIPDATFRDAWQRGWRPNPGHQ